MMNSVKRLATVTVMLVACGVPATLMAQTPATTSAQPADSARPAMVPPRFGTLKQDEVTMSLREEALLVKVTPLDEGVARLLAPDTYDRLHALAESRRKDLPQSFSPLELFLVSFYSYQPDVTFQPEDVQLIYQGRTLRPEKILPITPNWGKQRLSQQETETAVYAFEGPIDYQQVVTLRYGVDETDMWRGIITKLQTERAKALSRAAGGR